MLWVSAVRAIPKTEAKINREIYNEEHILGAKDE